MDILEPNKILLFVLMFMPGFVSIKVYGLIIASERKNFKDSLSEIIGYSALNFASLSWLIIYITSENFYLKYQFLFFVAIICILIIFPAIWPILFINLSKWKFISKHILSPIKMPWDYVFSKREPAWIIVHLKDGRRVGGKYAKDSRASAYPEKKQIFIEEIWKLSEDGSFKNKIDGTKGILILEDEIAMIEFLK